MKKSFWSMIMAIAMLMTSIPVAFAEGDWAVTDLKVNQMENPMTVDNQTPSFTWRMEFVAKGTYQSAYQLRVMLGDTEVWNTGKVEGDTAKVTYAGDALVSASHYDWEVTVWNESGETATANSWFETAFMDSAEFDAPLISAAKLQSYSGDYTVEYKIQVANHSGGFIFAGTDVKNNVAFYISTKSGAVAASLVTTTNGKGAVAKSWSNFDLAVTDTVQVKLEVTGTTVVPYVNGTALDSYTNANLISFGAFGFRHYNSSNDQETAYYDDLIIKDANGKQLLGFDFSAYNPFKVGALENGRLLVSPLSGNYSVSTFSELNATPSSGFTIETDFKVDSTAFSLVFGGTDARNLLFWQINLAAGAATEQVYLRPYAIVSGTASQLASIDITEQIAWSARNDWHKLKLDVSESGEIETYIDGVLVDTRTHSMATLSQIGFRQTKADSEIAWIDNYKLTDSDGHVLIAADFEDHLDPFGTGRTQNGALYLEKTCLFARDVEQKGAPMFRTEFALESGKTVSKARLYATSLGTYLAYINGQAVSEDKLAPGWTEYFDRIDYQAYDVTDLLQSGNNAIGAVIGSGWYAGHIGEGNTNYQFYGVDVAFKGQLIITYTDGTQQVIKTDDSWKCTTDTPYLVTDLQNGETYDATREQAGWNLPGFDASAWSAATLATEDTIRTNIDLTAVELKAQSYEPIRVYDTITPKSVTKVGEDSYIFDMGQNFAGVVTLKATGVKGQTIRLRYGEMLYDEFDGDLEGQLYTANLRTAHATDYYIFGADGEMEYTPSFTFHGFRYVEVTGLGYEPKAEDLTGVVWSSISNVTSSLDTSSDLVDQIYSNALWSQISNYMSLPLDCPQRDERLGWTGDAQVFAGTATLNADVNAFLNQYLSVLFEEQGPNGEIADFAPNRSVKKASAGAAGYADAAVVIPWILYTNYGDTEVIETYFENMKGWIGARMQKAGYEENGSLIIRSDLYGDWIPVGETTPVPVTSTAYFAYSTKLLAKMAAIIGEAEDAEYYENLFLEIREQYKNEFVAENGMILGDTQTAYILSLSFDLLDDPALEQKAAARLAEKIRANGNKLTTGFLGTNFICTTLAQHGYEDLAYTLLLQTEYPSWGYSVVNGATTIWERWNAYIAGGGLGANSQLGSTMNSYNHYARGSIVEWIFEEAAGIQSDPADPGYHHVIMKPLINDALEHINASYDSQYGKITSNWSIKDGSYTWTVTVPANATATVYAPGNGVPADMTCVTAKGSEEGANVYDILSGTYVFTGTLPQDASLLEDQINEIDLEFYQDQFGNTDALTTAYQNAADYLNGYAYTDAETAEHIAALESALDALTVKGAEAGEGVVAMKDYAADPTSKAYQISTVSEWLHFIELVESGVTFTGVTVYLKNDLDFQGLKMSGVGTYISTSDYSCAFKGTFEGGYHMLKNVNVVSANKGSGVFDVTYGATIRRLGVSGTVTGSSVVGGIAGYADGGTLIEYCWNEAHVSGIKTTDGVAGIAGNLRHIGTIRHCYNVGTVASLSGSAGICSWGQSNANAAVVTDCYNMGELVAINEDGVTMSIVHYGNATSAKTENCFYLDVYAGNSTQWAGTSSAAAAAFTDGTVAGALLMEQGATHPVFSVSAEEEKLAELLEELGKYDLNLFVSGDECKKTYEEAAAAYQKGDDTAYGSYIEALSDFAENLTLKNTYPHVPNIKDYDLYKGFGGKSFGVSDRAGMDLLREMGKEGIFGTHGSNDYAGYNIYLLNDIDMGGSENLFEPIVNFKGNLDGKGHALKNLYIDVTDVAAGVISALQTGGVVQNLGVASGSISLTSTGGTVAGGAIVGGTWRANIYNCWNMASVTGVGQVNMGGIVGGFGTSTAANYQIVNCYNGGAVTGSKAGGIAGTMTNNAKTSLLNCINTGTVSGTTLNALTNTLAQNIKNCYYITGSSGHGTQIAAADVASGRAAYLLSKNGVAGNVAAATWCMKDGKLMLGQNAPVQLTYQQNGETVATLYTDYEGNPIGTVEDPTPAENMFFKGWKNEAETYTADTVLTAQFGALTALYGKTALFVGDSITFGAMDDETNRRAWAGRLADDYGMISTNNGVSGSTISTVGVTTAQGRILSQLQAAEGMDFDYVMLHGGVNDANKYVATGVVSDSFDPVTFDITTFAGSLEQTIYHAVTLYGDRAAIGYLFNFQVPNCPYTGGRDMSAYAAIAKEICEKWDVAFYSMYDDAALNEALQVTTSTYLPDNLHPNAEGYDILTPYIAAFMQTMTAYEGSDYVAAKVAALKADAESLDASYFTAESYATFQNAVAAAGNDLAALEAAAELLVQAKEISVSLAVNNLWYREQKTFAVSNAEDLFALSNAVDHQLFAADAVALQTVDIDLKEHPNLRIGALAPFAMTYNGQNHAIRNMVINDSADRTALFPMLSGTLKNFTVEQAEVTANGWSAIVAGNTYGTDSLIENVHVKNSIFNKTGTNNGIGIIVAQPRFNDGSFTLRNCTVSNSRINTAVDTTRANVGFIASKTMATACLIENCYAWGNTFSNTGSPYTSVGGIIGESICCTIEGCGAYDNTFSGTFKNKGGILGVASTNSTTVKNSYCPDEKIAASASSFAEGCGYTEENCYTSCSVAMIESGALAYRLKNNSQAHWVQTNMPMVSEQGNQAFMVTLNHEAGSVVYYTDVNGKLIADQAALAALAPAWSIGDRVIPGAALAEESFAEDSILTWCYQVGDLNGTGALDLADVILLLQHLVGYDVELKGSADLNGDGRVSIFDAVMLLKKISA